MKFLNRIFNYLIAVGLIAYGLFFYFNKNKFFKSEVKSTQQTDFSSVDIDKVVNKYLRQTSEKMLQDQYDSKKALEKALQQPVKLNKVKEISSTDIPREQQIHIEAKEDFTASGLNSKMKAEIQNQQLEQVDKKEYARQFIENARKGGYHIELSEDLEVISVAPLRQPSQDIDAVEILPSN